MHRIGGQNPCRASCFTLVYLKQTVEFNSPPCRANCFTLVFLKQTVEFNRVARLLSPNPTRRPLPCLLIKYFFYDWDTPRLSSVSASRIFFWGWLNIYSILTMYLRIKFTDYLCTYMFPYCYVITLVKTTISKNYGDPELRI